MDEKNYKSKYRPASCGRAPWASYIDPGKRDAIMRKIRIECIQIYGYDMDTCPMRAVCIGKECLGRELPFLSPTAKPYLEKMKQDKQISIIENKYYTISDCNDCPIRNSCTSVCPMMNDFLNRHQKKQPELLYQETLDNYVTEGPERPVMPSEIVALELPWDCIKDDWKRIVKLRLHQRKDFLTIANTCGLSDQSQAKREFYYALTKLAEYAIVRKFIQEKKELLTLDQFQVLTARYIDNKKMVEIAKERKVQKSTISEMISYVFEKHNINWPIYVKREKGKIVYNVPEVLQ